MERWTDEELIARTPECPEAFDELYRRHERDLLTYFLRRTAGAEQAADLAAETFAAALVGARRYRPASAPAVAWLYGIARHRLLRSLERGRVEDRARRKLRMPPLVLDDDTIAAIERLEADDRAETWLEALPDEQAAAIRARVLDERPYAEIAASMRCSQAVVRQRVSRGLAALRLVAKGPS